MNWTLLQIIIHKYCLESQSQNIFPPLLPEKQINILHRGMQGSFRENILHISVWTLHNASEMILSYHCINFSLEKDQRRQRSLDLTSSPSSARNKFRNSRKLLESSMLTRTASSPPPTSRPPSWTSAAPSQTPRLTTWWARRPAPSTSPRWSRCLQRRWPEVSTALLSSC